MRGILLALVTTLLALTPAPALALGQKDVPYTATAIDTNGELSQFPATGQLFTLSSPGSGTGNNTVTVYAAWDMTNLYIGYDAKDEALFSTPEPRDSANAWNNDGIELNFDLKNKKALSPGDQDFRQWIFPLGQSNCYDGYGSGDTGDTSFTGNAVITFKLQGTLNDTTADTGYTAIVKIPWTDLATTPANGVSFGFDAASNDVDAVAGACTFLDWANLAKFAQPDQWGTLTLTGQGSTGTDRGAGKLDKGVYKLDWGAVRLDTRGGGITRPSEGCDCAFAATPPSGTSKGVGLTLLMAMILAVFARRRG